MNLEEVMKCKSFAILGDTLNESKFASKIKNAMINHGYTVYPVGKELKSLNDIDGEIEIIDLCINAKKGLELLKENKKKFKSIVIQPGAFNDELIKYLEDNKIPYIHDCLLVGLNRYAK